MACCPFGAAAHTWLALWQRLTLRVRPGQQAVTKRQPDSTPPQQQTGTRLRKESSSHGRPTWASPGHTLRPAGGGGRLYGHHPTLIGPLGRLPVKRRGPQHGSPKPQAAVGAAADAESGGWGRGRRSGRSQTVAGLGTEQAGWECLQASLHGAPKVATMSCEIQAGLRDRRRKTWPTRKGDQSHTAASASQQTGRGAALRTATRGIQVRP